MNIEELDAFLDTITLSEQQHLKHQGELSSRYTQIPLIAYEGKELYRFSFYRALGDRDIWLMKESRFTPIPLHIHDVIELNYVYRGQCIQIIDGNRVSLQEGDFCLLDCNTPHEVLPLAQDDIVITIDMRQSYLMATLLQHLASNTIVATFLARSIMDNVQSKRHLIFHAQDATVRLIMQLFMCDYFSETTGRGCATYRHSHARGAQRLHGHRLFPPHSPLSRARRGRCRAPSRCPSRHLAIHRSPSGHQTKRCGTALRLQRDVSWSPYQAQNRKHVQTTDLCQENGLGTSLA